MKSIPEKATRGTSLTAHQPECLYYTAKEYTFTLLDNAQRNDMSIHAGIRFGKIKPGFYGKRYTKLRSGKRQTRYGLRTLLLGIASDRHKAVRDMISIKERVQYDSVNRYQPLCYRR